MANPALFDLARFDTCHGLRPGMARPEVEDAVKGQDGAEMEEYATGAYASGPDWEVELNFSADGAARLRQICLDAGDVCWEGKPLQGCRVADLWALLGSPGPAVWQLGDASDDSEGRAAAAAEAPSDENLLAEGTLWLPERGLGFVVENGEIQTVVWRQSGDLPGRLAGPVTPAQLELSRQPDLAQHFLEKRLAEARAEERRHPAWWLGKIVTFAAIAGLAYVGKLGFEEMRVWHQAPRLDAALVAVEMVPMKQFRDFLPPALRWLFPRTRTVMVEGYRVEFTPPGDEPSQQVVLERNELYVPPQNAGAAVPIVYAAGPPPRVKGLSRADNAAFVEYVPWAIAIGALWLLCHLLLSVAPAAIGVLRSLMRRVAPSGTTRDPDRPELR